MDWQDLEDEITLCSTKIELRLFADRNQEIIREMGLESDISLKWLQCYYKYKMVQIQSGN